MLTDFGQNLGIFDKRDDAHFTLTLGAAQNIDGEDMPWSPEKRAPGADKTN